MADRADRAQWARIAPQPGGLRIPSSIVRLSVGVACALFGILVELGLNQVVALAPWLIVAFIVGMVAAILGGLAGGVVAAAIGYAGQQLVVPAAVTAVAPMDGVAWQIDLAVAVAALLVGLWIRGLLVRPDGRRVGSRPAGQSANGVDGPRDVERDRGKGHVPRATSAQDAPERRGARRHRDGSFEEWPAADPATAAERAILAAVRDLAPDRTPVQVADALARHAVAVTGARGAIVYLRAEDGGFVARGRFGVPDLTAPDRVADIAATAAGTLPDRATGSRDAGVLELPFGRGAVRIGLIRFVGGLDPAAPPGRAGGTSEPPSPDPRGGPLVELLGLVAADALERSALSAAHRSAERKVSVAAGRVAILARLAAELVRATTVDEAGRTLVDLAVDDLAAGFAVVHVPADGTGRFRLAHGRGYPAGLAAREAVTDAATSGPVTKAALDGTIVEVSGEDGWRAAFPAASNVPAITGVRTITAIPMRSVGGLQGVLVIGWRDRADRLAADDDLLAIAADQGAQALERAALHAHDEEARRFQEAFIAVVSHELRTPITTILAGSRLLRRRLEGDARSAELSDDIVFDADRLSRIVDDLLVLSRLERRHLTLGDEPVHLDHLLGRIVGSEAARWPGHRMEIRSRIGGHVVRGDETYIEQVLRNLVSNAAKYSPEGSLVEVAIDDGPPGEIVVRVLDRGSGVARAEVDDLFSLFYRSPTTAASAAGAGIGLFVARRLVAEMGGRMWASPRPDGGSEFGFALAAYPVDEGDVSDEGADGEHAGEPVRDDDPADDRTRTAVGD